MDLLVLGGTVFLGRHVVDAALDRGWSVTLFHRGSHPAHRPDEVDEVLGDRDGGLAALVGTGAVARRWDLVVDTSGYVPRVIRQSVAALHDRCDRYVFVSSVSAYADVAHAPITEATALHEPPADDVEDVAAAYGPLKVGCERVVLDAFGERGLAVRAGLLVGPWDPTGRFSYWPRRCAAGGRVLVPDAADQPVQWIDARDLAAWLCATAASGAVNATGPLGMATFGDLVAAAAAHGKPLLVRVHERFLLDAAVEPWTDLPLWLPPSMDHAGFLAVDSGLAEAAGLTTRPLADTVADTLAWVRRPRSGRGGRGSQWVGAHGSEGGEEDERTAGLSAAREADLLAAWDARMG